MLIGYNQATTLKNSDTMTDLKYAEKYGFDYIEFQMDPLYKYLKEHNLDELKNFFSANKIKPYSLNVLEFFNLKSGNEFKEVLDEFLRLCEIAKTLGIKIIILVPSPNTKGISKKRY